MNKNKAVDDWFASYDNPMKEIMLAVRDIILNANPKMEEDIKWKAPNFMYKGNMATFNPRAKKNASLMFHTGAKLNDDSNLLESDKPEARSAKFFNLEDLATKKEALVGLVTKWISLQDES